MEPDWKQALDESVRKWEARPQFGELSPTILARVPDDLLEQTIVDFVANFREWRDDRLVALLSRLPSGFSTVYTTWMLDAEVTNGGFHQYFWNSAGAYIATMHEALERLNALEHLRTFEQAVHLAGLKLKPVVDGLPVRAQLDAFSESALAGTFEHHDSRWYELGGLNAARVRFIRENPALFTARLPALAHLRLKVSALFRRVRLA